jgi:lysophospholipase L1-like esterase
MLIDFFGDSITEGAGATSQNKCYVERVGQILNCKVINHGVSGTRFAKQNKSSADPRWDLDFCYRLKDLNRNADLIFVFGGTNDFGHGDAPIGNKEDNTPDTFYGACNFLASSLLKMYKKEQIIFILPLHRVEEDNPRGEGFKEKPSLTLEGYRNIIKEVLDKYQIKYLDIRDNLGRAEDNPLFQDGIHPSDEGHELIAQQLVDYIRSELRV